VTGPAPQAITPRRFQSWPPWGLADWEIRAELAAPATGPVRRAALKAELDGRHRDRAAAARWARADAERAAERVMVHQATGGWP